MTLIRELAQEVWARRDEWTRRNRRVTLRWIFAMELYAAVVVLLSS